MSLIDCKVELGVNAFGWSGGNFILDDGTLGVLGTSKLSGFSFYDVSDHVQLLRTNRGKTRQFDYFNSGSAVVTFKNADRMFDPLNQDSQFYPTLGPRVVMKITVAGHPLFYGYVNDWDLQYDVANNDIAVAYCSDAFSILSNQLLSAFTPSAQLTGARINTVLNRSEINFRGGRRISDGNSTLGAYAVAANTNCLNYLRQIERSELGSLFVSANGDLVFRERADIPESPVLLFKDDGTELPYLTLDNEYGDELLYNYVRATSPAGAEQVKSDATSISTYQVSQLVYEDLLNSSTIEVENIAQSILNQYKEPKVRFTGFSVQVLGLTEDQKEIIYNAELTDFASVTKTFAVGTPSSITQGCLITGISHDVRPGSHTVTFIVENADFSLRLVLGDSFAGRLDYSLLDF
jgi:hypothetical protein